MAFMQHEIVEMAYCAVETTYGTEYVPSDLIGPHDDIVEALQLFCEGTILVDEDTNEPVSIEWKEGFLARMSAPGYLDCTEWSAHATEQDARDYLNEMYGDDEENE
jgi:hypothetical protein